MKVRVAATWNAREGGIVIVGEVQRWQPEGPTSARAATRRHLPKSELEEAILGRVGGRGRGRVGVGFDKRVGVGGKLCGSASCPRRVRVVRGEYRISLKVSISDAVRYGRAPRAWARNDALPGGHCVRGGPYDTVPNLACLPCVALGTLAPSVVRYQPTVRICVFGRWAGLGTRSSGSLRCCDAAVSSYSAAGCGSSARGAGHPLVLVYRTLVTHWCIGPTVTLLQPDASVVEVGVGSNVPH